MLDVGFGVHDCRVTIRWCGAWIIYAGIDFPLSSVFFSSSNALAVAGRPRISSRNDLSSGSAKNFKNFWPLRRAGRGRRIQPGDWAPQPPWAFRGTAQTQQPSLLVYMDCSFRPKPGCPIKTQPSARQGGWQGNPLRKKNRVRFSYTLRPPLVLTYTPRFV